MNDDDSDEVYIPHAYTSTCDPGRDEPVACPCCDHGRVWYSDDEWDICRDCDGHGRREH